MRANAHDLKRKTNASPFFVHNIVIYFFFSFSPAPSAALD